MTFELSFVFSMTILIAGIIALVKFSRIGRLYYPFIYLVWLGCINEPLSYFLILYQRDNIVNATIYDLCESLLYLWFFKNLGLFERRKSLLYWMMGLYICLWIAENFFKHSFGSAFNSYFSMVYAFSIVLLSVTAINKILFQEREIVRNPSFLICVGIVVYFIYRLVTEVFWLYGLGKSVKFQNDVYIILLYVNLLCNLIFALAILWMKKKQPFTLQF